MDILVKLFQNSGLFHVAENVIGFMDNSTVAQCRLVSKESNEFLANIWQMRQNIWRKSALKEATELCEKKFETYKRGPDGQRIEKSIFELWPDWKVALDELESVKQFDAVTYLLREYFKRKDGAVRFYPGNKSPLHFAAENSGESWYDHEEVKVWNNIIEILISTSLDFNTCDGNNNDVLHKACLEGSKKVVEVILNNAVKKGIDVKAVNGFNETIVQCALEIRYDANWPKNSQQILGHLFERRNEFDIDISQECVLGHGNILHRALHDEHFLKDFKIIFQWAIEQGINLSHVDSRGNTILHCACKYNAHTAVFLLLESDKYGIDQSVISSMANLRNGENKRPIDLAKESVFHESVHNIDIRAKMIQELEKHTSAIE